MTSRSRRQYAEMRLKLNESLPLYFRNELFLENNMVYNVKVECLPVSGECVFKCNKGVYYVKLCGNGKAFDNEMAMYDKVNAETNLEIHAMFLHPIRYYDDSGEMLIFDNTGKNMFNLCELYHQTKASASLVCNSFWKIKIMLQKLNAAGYCHNDIHAGNIVYDTVGRKFYFLDLENMTIGGKSHDLDDFEELKENIDVCPY